MRPPAGRTGRESRRRTARAYTTSTVQSIWSTPNCGPEPLFPGISEHVPLTSPQLALSRKANSVAIPLDSTRGAAPRPLRLDCGGKVYQYEVTGVNPKLADLGGPERVVGKPTTSHARERPRGQRDGLGLPSATKTSMKDARHARRDRARFRALSWPWVWSSRGP